MSSKASSSATDTSSSAKAKSKKPNPFDELLLEKVSRVLGEREPSKLLRRKFLLLMRMLRCCDYEIYDLVTVVTHAMCYFEREPKRLSHGMGEEEKTNVFILLCFVAHSFVLDEVCPLTTWHTYLFRDYCDVATLNHGLVTILRILAWQLRLRDSEQSVARQMQLMAEHDAIMGLDSTSGAAVDRKTSSSSSCFAVGGNNLDDVGVGGGSSSLTAANGLAETGTCRKESSSGDSGYTVSTRASDVGCSGDRLFWEE
jgi:hypothetical protein